MAFPLGLIARKLGTSHAGNTSLLPVCLITQETPHCILCDQPHRKRYDVSFIASLTGRTISFPGCLITQGILQCFLRAQTHKQHNVVSRAFINHTGNTMLFPV